MKVSLISIDQANAYLESLKIDARHSIITGEEASLYKWEFLTSSSKYMDAHWDEVCGLCMVYKRDGFECFNCPFDLCYRQPSWVVMDNAQDNGDEQAWLMAAKDFYRALVKALTSDDIDNINNTEAG